MRTNTAPYAPAVAYVDTRQIAPPETGANAHLQRLDAASRERIEHRAQKLFSMLPPAFRLAVTRERFPHVLNLLAAEWNLPSRFLALLDDLLIDRRGRRSGFPYATVAELAALRAYYLEEVHPELQRELSARDPEAWR